MCHNSSTCQVYILWVELGHSHFSSGKQHWNRALKMEPCALISV